MTDKTCISCGMPIRSESEAAAGDINKPYCHRCANSDGTMKSYDEVQTGMTQFIVKSQGLDKAAATDIASELMSKMPAWSAE